MTEGNVDPVRRLFEAFERRDHSGIEAQLDPQATWYPAIHGLTDRSSYSGPEEISRFLLEELDATLAGFRPEAVREEPLSGGLVLTTSRFSGESRSAGLPVEQVLFHLFRVRKGKVVEARGFTSRDTALEAAGL